MKGFPSGSQNIPFRCAKGITFGARSFARGTPFGAPEAFPFGFAKRCLRKRFDLFCNFRSRFVFLSIPLSVYEEKTFTFGVTFDVTTKALKYYPLRQRNIKKAQMLVYFQQCRKENPINLRHL